ncbi:MAG: sugar phosphate isomerase/epimerase family protein [Verrucomicrobiota bacterium]
MPENNAPLITTRPVSRRSALGTLITSSGLALALPAVPHAGSTEDPKPRFIFFSKPFQALSFEELAQKAAEIGYDGIEFPVRPGGHIEPAAVADQLPVAVETFRKHGLALPLITTGINRVSQAQQTEQVLRTAAGLGITHFRMAYYKYDLNKPIPAQLDAIRPMLKDLIALSTELGIKPLYQNHSGSDYVGAPLWDLYELFKDYTPNQIGIAYDIGHALIEGTHSWEIQFQLLKSYIDTPYIKAPTWQPDRNRFGWAPLGQGIIPNKYYQLLKTHKIPGPTSIHVEYIETSGPASHPTYWQALTQDLNTIKTKI